MMTDPYKTLGVSRDASEEEIKKAYRDLARKFHPDNYATSPLSEVAQEKMKEINEAYDAVMRERQGRGDSSSGYSYSSGTGNFDYIRVLINNRSFYEAEIQLDAVAKDGRNAEWYYLKGCVFMGRGWYFEASKHFHCACEMDPHNPEYAAALRSMKNMSYEYDKHSDRRGSSCSTCDICTGLICADCCCEAMGGDLIGCC